MGTETATAPAQGSTEAAAGAASKAATPTTTPTQTPPAAAPAAAASGASKPAGTETKPGTSSEVKPAETKPGQSTPPAAASGTETKPAESKPGETKPGAPEKYDLKLPETPSVDAGAVERLSVAAKELGLPQEAAQKMLSLVDSEVAASRTAFVKSHEEGGALWNARLDQYEKDALADPEIGGTPEKLKESSEKAKRVASKLFSKPVLEFLQKSGLGSQKDLIRDLARLHEKIAEDKIVSPASTAGGGKLADKDVFYSGS